MTERLGPLSEQQLTGEQRAAAQVRYRSAIGTRLSELAILVTAREWNQRVEWAIHAPIAQTVGIAPEVIDAIAHRRRRQCCRMKKRSMISASSCTGKNG